MGHNGLYKKLIVYLYNLINYKIIMSAPEGNQNAKKWNLTDKQNKFCREYIIDLNATQAAIRAGYSKKTARSQGQRLLINVDIQEFISFLKQNTAKKLEITHEMLTAEWAKMAFSSFSNLHNTWIERKDFEDLKKENPAILDCIQEIVTQLRTTKDSDGDLSENEYVKIKLYSKTTALENLGKHIDYYNADNKSKSQITPVIVTSSEHSKKEIDKLINGQ